METGLFWFYVWAADWNPPFHSAKHYDDYVQ